MWPSTAVVAAGFARSLAARRYILADVYRRVVASSLLTEDVHRIMHRPTTGDDTMTRSNNYPMVMPSHCYATKSCAVA